MTVRLKTIRLGCEPVGSRVAFELYKPVGPVVMQRGETGIVQAVLKSPACRLISFLGICLLSFNLQRSVSPPHHDDLPVDQAAIYLERSVRPAGIPSTRWATNSVSSEQPIWSLPAVWAHLHLPLTRASSVREAHLHSTGVEKRTNHNPPCRRRPFAHLVPERLWILALYRFPEDDRQLQRRLYFTRRRFLRVLPHLADRFISRPSLRSDHQLARLHSRYNIAGHQHGDSWHLLCRSRRGRARHRCRHRVDSHVRG